MNKLQTLHPNQGVLGAARRHREPGRAARRPKGRRAAEKGFQRRGTGHCRRRRRSHRQDEAEGFSERGQSPPGRGQVPQADERRPHRQTGGQRQGAGGGVEGVGQVEGRARNNPSEGGGGDSDRCRSGAASILHRRAGRKFNDYVSISYQFLPKDKHPNLGCCILLALTLCNEPA